jgi:hypothetical protein
MTVSPCLEMATLSIGADLWAELGVLRRNQPSKFLTNLFAINQKVDESLLEFHPGKITGLYKILLI